MRVFCKDGPPRFRKGRLSDSFGSEQSEVVGRSTERRGIESHETDPSNGRD